MSRFFLNITLGGCSTVDIYKPADYNSRHIAWEKLTSIDSASGSIELMRLSDSFLTLSVTWILIYYNSSELVILPWRSSRGCICRKSSSAFFWTPSRPFHSAWTRLGADLRDCSSCGTQATRSSFKVLELWGKVWAYPGFVKMQERPQEGGRGHLWSRLARELVLHQCEFENVSRQGQLKRKLRYFRIEISVFNLPVSCWIQRPCRIFEGRGTKRASWCRTQARSWARLRTWGFPRACKLRRKRTPGHLRMAAFGPAKYF